MLILWHGIFGNLSIRDLYLEMLTIGFLKKLPQLPKDLGSGSFDFLILITSSDIFLIVSSVLTRLIYIKIMSRLC